MQLKVLTVKLFGDERNEDFDQIFHQLPAPIQERIYKYKVPNERNLKIVGKGLLMKALKDWNIAPDTALANLKYTGTQQPYIKGLNVNLSISHSADLIVCAVAKDAKVGVDVEKIKPVKLSLMQAYIDPETWSDIINAPDPDSTFFHHWTIRESAIKASGLGLEQIELSEIKSTEKTIELRNETFYYKMLPLSHAHASCLACSEEIGKVDMVKLSLTDLLFSTDN
jgi:4'-phosphopantetheinyl transferase